MTSSTAGADRMIDNFLAAAKSESASAPGEIETVDYDWDSPSSFTPAEFEKVEKVAEQAGIEIAKALGGQIHENVELQADKPRQCYAGKLSLLQDEATNYCTSLSADGAKACGLIAIPAGQTFEWVAKVLGGSSGAAEQDRELSSLESALLQDILDAVTKALSNTLQQAGGGPVQSGTEVSAKAELPGDDSDEYVLMSFRIDPEAQQPVISVVLATDVVATAVGAGGGKTESESAEAIQKKMRENVERSNVQGFVRLGTANLTVREVVGLEAGDVLLIHKRIDEPAEFVMNGNVVLTGYPSSCEGQYALRIAAPEKNTGKKKR